jgi:hypothetical protein
MAAALEDNDMEEELVEDEEGGEAVAATLCMLWESLWTLNAACRAPAAAPAPGCRGDVGLIRAVGQWVAGIGDRGIREARV